MGGLKLTLPPLGKESELPRGLNVASVLAQAARVLQLQELWALYRDFLQSNDFLKVGPQCPKTPHRCTQTRGENI